MAACDGLREVRSGLASYGYLQVEVGSVEVNMTDIWSRIELAALMSGKMPETLLVLVGRKEWGELQEYPRLEHKFDPNIPPMAGTYRADLEITHVQRGYMEIIRTEDESRLTLVFDKEEVE